MPQKLSDAEILQNMKNQVETWRAQGYSDRSNKASLKGLYKPETHHLIKQVFKTPGALAESIGKVPEFNKDALVAYLKNYGSGFDDDNYEAWANKKGKQLVKTPLNKDFIGTPYHKQWYGADRDYTYAPQYLEDEEWLQTMWPDVAQDALEYYGGIQRQKQSIDPTDERSWGPKKEDD